MSEKEETVNSRQGETVKSRDGYISIYECSKNFYHSTYKHAWTVMGYIKWISMSMLEQFVQKYKLDFEDIWDRLADFKES